MASPLCPLRFSTAIFAHYDAFTCQLRQAQLLPWLRWCAQELLQLVANSSCHQHWYTSICMFSICMFSICVFSICVFCRPVSTTDQVYSVIRSLLPSGVHEMKTIKMADIEELAASKVSPAYSHPLVITVCSTSQSNPVLRGAEGVLRGSDRWLICQS